jgi:hypothetical protein
MKISTPSAATKFLRIFIPKLSFCFEVLLAVAKSDVAPALAEPLNIVAMETETEK